MRIREHWALVGYITLVAVAIITIQLYQMHTNHEIRRTQRQIVFTAYRDCTHGQVLADNQQVLVRTVIALLDEPEFRKLGLRQDDVDFIFRAVLMQIPRFQCLRPDSWPPQVADIPGS